MLVKFTPIVEGPGPSEAVVGILTAEGQQEEVVLSKRLMQHGAIDVGTALLREGDHYLIELPRESTRGRWRIWVPKSEIVTTEALVA